MTTELTALTITLILASPALYVCYDVIKDCFVGDITSHDVWLVKSGLPPVTNYDLSSVCGDSEKE